MKKTLTALLVILISGHSFAQRPNFQNRVRPRPIALWSKREINPVLYYMPSPDKRKAPTPDTAVYLLLRGDFDNYADDTTGAAITNWALTSKNGRVLDTGVDTMFYADYSAWDAENKSMAKWICNKQKATLK